MQLFRDDASVVSSEPMLSLQVQGSALTVGDHGGRSRAFSLADQSQGVVMWFHAADFAETREWLNMLVRSAGAALVTAGAGAASASPERATATSASASTSLATAEAMLAAAMFDEVPAAAAAPARAPAVARAPVEPEPAPAPTALAAAASGPPTPALVRASPAAPAAELSSTRIPLPLPLHATMAPSAVIVTEAVEKAGVLRIALLSVGGKDVEWKDCLVERLANVLRVHMGTVAGGRPLAVIDLLAARVGMVAFAGAAENAFFVVSGDGLCTLFDAVTLESRRAWLLDVIKDGGASKVRANEAPELTANRIAALLRGDGAGGAATSSRGGSGGTSGVSVGASASGGAAGARAAALPASSSHSVVVDQLLAWLNTAAEAATTATFTSFEREVATGLPILYAISGLTGETLPRFSARVTTVSDRLENLAVIRRLVDAMGIDVEWAEADFVQGASKPMIRLVAAVRAFFASGRYVAGTVSRVARSDPPASSAPPSVSKAASSALALPERELAMRRSSVMHMDWLNNELKPLRLHVTDLTTDLRDGVVIARLIERLSGVAFADGALRTENLSGADKLANLKQVVRRLAADGVATDDMRIEELMRGDLGSVVLLLGRVETRYKKSRAGPAAAAVDSDSPRELTLWLNRVLATRDASWAAVDLASDLADGLLLMMAAEILTHKFRDSSFIQPAVRREQREHNMTLVRAMLVPRGVSPDGWTVQGVVAKSLDDTVALVAAMRRVFRI